MSNLFQNLLQKGITVTSNKKRAVGGVNPTLHTTPASGGFQLSEMALRKMGLGKGDYAVLANLPDALIEALGENFIPTTDSPAGPVVVILYPGGVDADGKTLGSKISLVGSNGQFSSSRSWDELGGTKETKSIYNLGETVYGFGINGDAATLVTDETDNETEFDGIITLSDSLEEDSQFGSATTVAEAKAGKGFYILSFMEVKDKLERNAGEEEEGEDAAADEVPAKGRSRHNEAAATAGAVEGLED